MRSRRLKAFSVVFIFSVWTGKTIWKRSCGRNTFISFSVKWNFWKRIRVDGDYIKQDDTFKHSRALFLLHILFLFYELAGQFLFENGAPQRQAVGTFDVCLARSKVCPTDIVRPHAAQYFTVLTAMKFNRFWQSLQVVWNWYRPLSHLWECSQTGVQSNKIFLQKRKFPLFCPPVWLHSHRRERGL